MNRLRTIVLLNAAAGTAAKLKLDKEGVHGLVASAFSRHAIAPEIHVLASGELQQAAERARGNALSGDCDAIVIGGGDGSVRTVAELVAGTGIPLGVLPLGTLNHFAKDLELPIDLEPAVGIIAAGLTRDVDVGEVNGQIFINNSSIGLYPLLILERARTQRSSGLSKWPAMMLAVLEVIRRLPFRRLEICAQGWVEPVRSPCVFVGNNVYRISGAGFGRRDHLDAAKLFVCVAKAENRLALFWLGCRSIIGALDQSDDLRAHELATTEVRSRASRLLVALDGEVRLLRSPLKYRSRPKALRVFAPASNP